MIEITKTLQDGRQITIKVEESHVWATCDHKMLANATRLTLAPASFPGCMLIDGKIVVTAEEAAQINAALKTKAPIVSKTIIHEGTGQDLQQSAHEFAEAAKHYTHIERWSNQ